ncbi:MAG: hypothetical protein AVDCRST_MAG40-1014 [uncultured Gemmatimonadaceae bacterium]|uniref:ABC-type transport auxiliary lipoprotein component domain-containing protein n=1 Tax=uncultured Gemmatimonadaceae bacterium TaxID=246130 RepID=A0A6J4KPP1_9BACT|nr:MAG: hypothetical protein AVDCRST_MAG40-1014 [uncultured Gemmatimonadaceae bacterium]
MPHRLLAALALPALVAACASRPTSTAAPGAPASAGAAAAAAVARPLGGLVGERVAVAPVQRLRVVDSTLAAGASSADVAGYLSGLDSAIAAAAAERSSAWVYAPTVSRTARRNPTYSPDVHRLAVSPLLAGRRLGPDNALPDPLASQLRTVVALNDARYVVVPAELRLEPAPSPARGRLVLRVALVDARASQLRWAGEIAAALGPAPAPALSPLAAATLATRFADLIAAP